LNSHADVEGQRGGSAGAERGGAASARKPLGRREDAGARAGPPPREPADEWMTSTPADMAAGRFAARHDRCADTFFAATVGFRLKE
jgi:hypothetical protein